MMANGYALHDLSSPPQPCRHPTETLDFTGHPNPWRPQSPQRSRVAI